MQVDGEALSGAGKEALSGVDKEALGGPGKEALLESGEQAIIDYLHADPDFFVRHPRLLAQLNLPHESGRAVSLVEHQMAIMRERNVDMRRRMNQLLDAARQNDGLFAKTRSLTLALLDASSLQELNEVLATYVLVDFEADFVCCHTHGGQFSLDHIQNHDQPFPFSHLFSGDKALCTTLREDELQMVFPISQHPGSGSAVMLPLELETGTGALCIGSKDPQRFSNDMETLFVTYIADVLTKVLARL
jgi:uncharacterized protein YigA (DUF484 family)